MPTNHSSEGAMRGNKVQEARLPTSSSCHDAQPSTGTSIRLAAAPTSLDRQKSS